MSKEEREQQRFEAALAFATTPETPDGGCPTIDEAIEQADYFIDRLFVLESKRADATATPRRGEHDSTS